MKQLSYSSLVIEIKAAILESRYRASTLVNKELLSLYFHIGKYISYHTRDKNWGLGAIDIISNELQQELPGLRGFSATNIKNMRIFYEEWNFLSDFVFNSADFKILFNNELLNRQSVTADLENTDRQSVTADLENTYRQLPTADMKNRIINTFLKVGFTQHREIIRLSDNLEARLFYIEQCATMFWNAETLKNNLKNKSFERIGKLSTNFDKTIKESSFRNKALLSFKDELLLDFINIEDADEEIDERILESAIIQNIKKFIMALGSDFSFIGNQYRLIIEQEEFFIDLLFFNRKIQSLVAIELKKGKFKAEYAGKMNLYLSALDEYVKQAHENPSIGIILCKEKNNKIVEFAFRDTSKPMGVVTYKTPDELPEKYKNIIPDIDRLKELM